MESMACGLPVVATDTGAISELLDDGRGFLIAPEFEMVDVWGNSLRHFIDIKTAATCIEALIRYDKPEYANKARKYIEGRTWDKPAQQLHEKIVELTERKD